VKSIRLLFLFAALAALPAAAQTPAKKFSLRSDDGKFLLNIGGRLQAYYELDAPAAGDDTSQFRIRRARTVFDGHLYDPKLTYEMQIELAGSAAFLKRAYVNYKQTDALQFRAGRFKAPFGRQQLTSSFKQQLTERSVVEQEFTKGDDDGVMVWGTPRNASFEYYAGVFNGDGANKNSQQDSENQWFGRVVWSPQGKFAYSESAIGLTKPQWALGVNAYHNGGWLFDVNGVPGIQAPSATNAGDDASINAAGVEAALRWKGLYATGEAFSRSVDPHNSTIRTIAARGWFVQGGYLITAKSEAGLRYGVLDLDSHRSGDRTVERAIFFNHYLHGHDLKIQTDFTELLTDPDLTERRMRVQFVLSF
jgi:phosphate-selective porin